MRKIAIREAFDNGNVISNVFIIEKPETCDDIFSGPNAITLPIDQEKRGKFVKKWSNINKYLYSILLIPLSACGPSKKDSDGQEVPLTGFVIDDYLRGSTVFRDANGNNLFDVGETSVLSGSDGSFTIGGDKNLPLVNLNVVYFIG